jgi:glyceraldehyde-3-phosphate dehydrogenase (NADP+)
MEKVADALVKKVVEKMAKLTVGFPDADCDITPVISTTSAEFIEGLANDARAKGARFHQVTT